MFSVSIVSAGWFSDTEDWFKGVFVGSDEEKVKGRELFSVTSPTCTNVEDCPKKPV